MKPVDVKTTVTTTPTTVSAKASVSFPLFGYVLKRILIFLPTLFVISLVTFILIAAAPGDPAESMLNRSAGEGQASDKLAGDQAYRELRTKLGLDLPVFYFSLGSAASCDTINRIAKSDHRETLERMTYRYGNWPQISSYYYAVNDMELASLQIKKDSANAVPLSKLREITALFYLQDKENDIQGLLGEYTKSMGHPSLASLQAPFQKVQTAFAAVKSNTTVYKRFIPALHWNGQQNQYHRWLFGRAAWLGTEEDPNKAKGFIRGDFGISFFAKRPVSSMIWDSIGITMLISVLVILLEYLLAIPLGVNSAIRKGSKFDSTVTTVLFMLYSLPSFWIGTLAIFFLCGGDYLNIFPPYWMSDVTWDDGFLLKLGDLAYHLILPLLVATYGGFAFLTRQMRGSMVNVLRQDYIRTAFSKGLDDKTVFWSHAFRNSLLPIITIFASVFPALISGAIILEFLFTIPGLGQVTYAAVLQKDYPVILTNTMFAAILTLVGYLVADILYAVVDPRISYTSAKK
jgi:peptide/nickel transport system permease protein